MTDSMPGGAMPPPGPQQVAGIQSLNQLESQEKSQSRKGPALIAGGVVAAYSLLVGNPFVANMVLRELMIRRRIAIGAVTTFPRWTLPGSGDGLDNERVLFLDFDAPRALITLSGGTVGLISQWARLALLLVLVPAMVWLVSQTKPGEVGLGARAISTWGACILGSGAAGILSNFLFQLLNDDQTRHGFVGHLMTGFGLGATFGAAIGVAITLFVVALPER